MGTTSDLLYPPGIFKLSSGKVDRLALPELGSERPELEVPFVAPRTPVEETLAQIWVEVLGLDELGIHDNFLELGGDSLLASQVIARVIQTFQVEVPLRSLWESPTIGDMAVTIIQGQVKAADPADIERMLKELNALSNEEAQRLIGDSNESMMGTEKGFEEVLEALQSLLDALERADMEIPEVPPLSLLPGHMERASNRRRPWTILFLSSP